MRKTIVKRIFILFLSLFLLMNMFPIISFAKSYSFYTIPQERLPQENPDPFGFFLIFRDTDGQFKVGNCAEIFDYLKYKFGNESIDGILWKDYDRTGDFYDIVVFAFNVFMKNNDKSVAMVRNGVKDILHYTDDDVEYINQLQEILIPACIVATILFWALSLSRLSEERKLNRKNAIIHIVYAIIALLALSHIKEVTTFFCSLNNTITEKVATIVNGVNPAEHYFYYDIQDLKNAAQASECNSFFKSKDNAQATIWNLEFGFLFRFLVSTGSLVIIRSMKLIFCLSMVVFPVCLTDLPFHRLKGMAGAMILTMVAYCIIPSLYIITFAMAMELQSVVHYSSSVDVFIATFAIPLSTIPIMLGTKQLAKTAARVAAYKIF